MTLAGATLGSVLGCSREPEMCSVTPIDIEETLSDSRDLQGDLTKAKERLGAAQADLARWQTRLADRQAEVPALQAELARLKKASGVTEDITADVQPEPVSDDDLDIIPRSN